MATKKMAAGKVAGKAARAPKRMSRTLKRKWIAALRSGKFKQAHHVLRAYYRDSATGEVVTTGYCCLGVLCEVAGVKYVAANSYPGETGGTAVAFLGLSAQRVKALAAMNDMRVPFDKIADYIEKRV